jgi:hypothetical protein
MYGAGNVDALLDEPQAPPSTSDFALKFNYHEIGYTDTTLLVMINLPIDEKKPSGSHGSKRVAEVRVKTLPFKVDERYLSLFFSDWKPGDFDRAFPELRAVSSGIGNLEIADAVQRIQLEVASEGRDISILGLSIPISQVSQWGAIILLSVQLYFWLHLHELVKKIEPAAEGWDVAWIGLYTARASFAVALISSCILSVAAAMTLALKIYSLTFYYRRSVHVAVAIMVFASVILSLLTSRKLYQLRQSARQGSTTQPDTDPV